MRQWRDTAQWVALALVLALGTGCSEQTTEIPEAPEGDAGLVFNALRESDPLIRAERLARAFQTLSPEALPEVRRAYTGAFFDLGDTELVLLAEWWARFDAQGALDWSYTERRANANQVRQAILRAWARRDPEAALRLAENQRADNVRALWMDAVLSGWEESGRPGAFEFVRAMGPGPDRQRALAALARRKVLREGVAAAFDWGESLPDDEDGFKLDLLRRVGSAGAEVDPELTAQRARRLADGPYADGLLRHVGTRWAKRDGEAALRWLASMPPGHPRDDGMSETYRAWVRWARADALSFMDGPGRSDPAFDPATALYVQVLAETDPLAAIGVAQEIRDEDLRWATVGRVWRVWWIDDEHAASAWFETHAAEMPEFYRERIRVIPSAVRALRDKKAEVVAP